MLTLAQARHGVSVLRVAGEMKSADAFNGDNLACVKRSDGACSAASLYAVCSPLAQLSCGPHVGQATGCA